MNRLCKALLILVALVCFGVAASYPIRYFSQAHNTQQETQDLAELRNRIRQENGLADYALSGITPEPAVTAAPTAAPTSAPTPTPSPEATPAPTEAPQPSEAPAGQAEGLNPEEMAQAEDADAYVQYIRDYVASVRRRAAQEQQTQQGAETPLAAFTPQPTATPTPSPAPTPTPDRRVRTGALAYPELPKVSLDPDRILPELKDIYARNHDLVGWLTIPDSLIDYPVMQPEDMEYYLTHDFYGNKNINGTLILDAQCDPYTPSYNLIISGHHMNNGNMFGRLTRFIRESYWQEHKVLEFDTLMERKRYVIFAGFYSADYDEDQEGFRYNADIRYRRECDAWLAEIRANQIYDTGIDVAFGDEFLTLTTCYRRIRKNGRFVLVARRIREGESF